MSTTNISSLIGREFETIDWKSNFQYPGLVRIRTIRDGSCFFHAIANAFFEPYRSGLLDGKSISKTDIVRNFRRDLSIKLGEKININLSTSPTHYDLLGKGQLKEFAKQHPQYTLSYMQKELDSNSAVDNVYNEFIGDQIHRDIYLLDNTKQDVYPTGDDTSLLIKDRLSIVLLVLPGHYELVGLQGDNKITTCFKSDHPLIQAIRRRLLEIRTVRPESKSA